MYVWVEDARMRQTRWQCHMCDPWMQVAGDILCHLAQGSPLDAVLQWRWDDFEQVLAGLAIMEHAGAAMLTLHKAVIDYQVRACFTSPQAGEDSIEPPRSCVSSDSSGVPASNNCVTVWRRPSAPLPCKFPTSRSRNGWRWARCKTSV